MTIKERVARAVQTATQLGLRRAGWILWACYGLLLLIVIYLAVGYSTTDDSVSITLTRIDAEDARGFAKSMAFEQAMVESVAAQRIPEFRPGLHGYPILYALPMAGLLQADGSQALAAFNVVCLLLTMLIVQQMGMQIWSIRGSVRKIGSLPKQDLEKVVKAATANDAPKPEPPSGQPSQSVTATLFGCVAMLIFAVNPIVFSEVTRPSPRPLAYLLTTLALFLSLRVLQGKRMPRVLCMLLVLLACLVHLPSIVGGLPVVLIASFGDLVTSVEQRKWARKLGSNSRAVLVTVLVTALLPFAGHFLTYFDSIRVPLLGFVNQYLPESLIQAGPVLMKYLDIVSVNVGAFLKNHAPLLAVLSTIPLPDMKGIVERTMLFYGAGLLVGFTFVLHAPEPAQLYPAMLPLSLLGAIGIVNALNAYVDNAPVELARLSLRFFGTLTALPIIGTAMTWFSSLRLQEQYDEFSQGYNSPLSLQTTLIAVAALLGLAWQLIKRWRGRPGEPPTSR